MHSAWMTLMLFSAYVSGQNKISLQVKTAFCKLTVVTTTFLGYGHFFLVVLGADILRCCTLQDARNWEKSLPLANPMPL